MSADRRGAVLVAVVLTMVAMHLLAHAALLLALSAHRGTEAALANTQARAAARGASWFLSRRLAEAGWDSVARGSVVGETAVPGSGGRARGALERLGQEAWLVWGEAIDPRTRARVRGAVPVWRLDPVARVAAFRAVVGGPGAGAGVVRSGIDTRIFATRSTSPWCRERRAEIEEVVPPGPWPAVASDTTPPLRLGLLGEAAVLNFGTDVPDARWEPEPVLVNGRCGRGEDHAGDPRRPSGPCGEEWVVRRRIGDLVLAGTGGQGLLVVTGDLTLFGGSQWRGLLLVGGDLRLRAGAVLTGLARVGGALVIEGGAEIRGSACDAGAALSAVEPRPFRVPEGVGWMETPGLRGGG